MFNINLRILTPHIQSLKFHLLSNLIKKRFKPSKSCLIVNGFLPGTNDIA